MLKPGTRLGQYEILGSIGAGGMGEVYRAQDTNLRREVAIKVVAGASGADDSARERLAREARTASKLNHPNICTIFDASVVDGQVFIVMELVEGEPLRGMIDRGPMPADRAVQLAAQLASGLAHAHERGIVHRDLKSANIIVTPDGRAKILDFGLAKSIAEHPAAATTAHALTEKGVVAGTTAYLAPELLRGSEADARSDIWSLGVVMFEMVSGMLPFTGHGVFELTAAILTEPTPSMPLAIPPGLQALIRRCLLKQPGERYQHAAEVRAALEAISWSEAGVPVVVPTRPRRAIQWAALAVLMTTLATVGWWMWDRRGTSPPTTITVRSLAVLPLTNLSGDAAQDLLADGMTDALITNLARLKGLDVISRTSVMQYRNSSKRLPDIARELGVDAIVQGAVIRAGDRVRISAQLIEAATDRHLWTDEYDRDLRDVLSLQRDVARDIAGQVRVALTPQEEAAFRRVRQLNPEAHAKYTEARFLVYRFNEPSIARAIQLLEEALQLEPEFADAWATLASAHAERGIWGTPGSSAETSARAHEAITRAMALDPQSAEAHAVLGQISLIYDWDWVGAERAMLRSIDLSPGDSRVRNTLTSLYQALRRFPEAVATAEQYRRLDPASPLAVSQVGRARYRARQFDGAIAAFNEGIAMDPSYGPNYARLADVYIALGQFDTALEWLNRGQKVLGNTRRQADGFATALALSGRRAEAEAELTQLIERAKTSDQTYVSIAQVHTALGNYDAAFEWLDRAFEARSATLFLVNAELKFDAIRNDPRFTNLLKRMRFPGY